MKLKEFNFEYISNDIKIRSLCLSDIDNNFELLKKWNIKEENREKLTDDEIKSIINCNNQSNLFMKTIMFLIFKNSKLIGSFIIFSDDSIKFKESIYNKQVYNIVFNFIDEIGSTDISTFIRLSIDALKFFRLRIKTLYSFKIYHGHLKNNFLENGFEELETEYFYSKNEKFLEKRGFENSYKISSIFIKNI